jgi:Domain of unknown function (DUF5916)/Carbohydrate family 9 binding domain-like
MRKHHFLLAGWMCICTIGLSQTPPKSFPAKRTTAAIKIDGKLDEACWKETIPITDFVESSPNFGAGEEAGNKTEIWVLYDNTSIYIAGFCHEKSKDSISQELVGRDIIGVNDFAGIVLDTYNDKINAVGFYVTPLGEQYDAKYSNTVTEDDTWNAVWDSESQLRADGWTFEMRIPYSALRFVSKDHQTWGLNFVRNRQKSGQQFMWNPVDPKVNGFVNQEGLWTDIEKIKPPVRLSFSPYFSTYLNHYPYHTSGVKDLTSSVNGGVDVKYGISDAFTLDMTLVPDFGQVQSDNKVLNLSPFEVRYNENRSFFTEGTELFNKGNLFYSRRVGGTPIHAGDVYDQLGPDEEVIRNPVESKLINATKISGRTKKGFGLGIFNAVTKPMYATIQDTITGGKRKIKTGPLTNYNILVFDQTLKNNSAISFINTNVWRSGTDYDANVSAALFDISNRKNTYKWTGKFSVSQLINQGKNTTGYAQNVSFSKKSGRWNFQLLEDLANEKYDINDMGILFNNNYIDHYLSSNYRWLKPAKWYKRVQLNYNIHYSMLYKRLPGQKINSSYQGFNTNVNANAQLKNLWEVEMFFGFVPRGNDFYEPRTTGYSFRTPQRIQFNPAIETNETKKYSAGLNYFLGIRSLFHSLNHQISFEHRYRFNDRFSVSQQIFYNPTKNDAGYYDKYYQQDINGNYILDPNGNPILEDILFSRRDLKTVENILSFKFSFNNKSGITLRARHYWSKVTVRQLYDLQTDGTLKPTRHNNVTIAHQNYNIFNIDAVYTWQFAPGSFVNIVWKEEGSSFDQEIGYLYFKNLDHTLSAPQNNNLSVKVIYYLDYLSFKKRK